MFDDTGKQITSAGPSTPVEILGFENVPVPELFQVLTSEREAREVVSDYSRRDMDPVKSRSKLGA